MNELLQKHGCANVFTIPEGLKELMSDITREVLREQPAKIFDFIANYLSVLLITREHGVMASKILDDLCDCRPSVSEHLLQLGLQRNQAEDIAQVIQEEIEGSQPEEGKEKVREAQMIKRVLTKYVLDEDLTAKVCQIARNAYREHWYRKQLLEQSLKEQLNEPWEIAAEHTLQIYKKTHPSLSELTRAAQRIQAAYKGYHIRRKLLRHLKPKPKPQPKVDLPGPPIDIAESREIDLGHVIDITVKEDDVKDMFDVDASNKLGLQYDPMRTITHVVDEDEPVVEPRKIRLASVPQERRESRVPSMVPVESSRSHVEIQDRNVEASLQKISFATAPQVITEELDEGTAEETVGVTSHSEQTTEGDVAHEVPEDITEEYTESGAVSSVVTSEPNTAEATDVEDAADDIMPPDDQEEHKD